VAAYQPNNRAHCNRKDPEAEQPGKSREQREESVKGKITKERHRDAFQ